MLKRQEARKVYGRECRCSKIAVDTYIQMGVFGKKVTADWNVIGDGKELSIQGSHLSALTYPSVIKGIEKGLLRTNGLISHSFTISQWKDAFYTAEKHPEAIKVMFRF